MSDLKKSFIKLMEDVSMDYQAPFDANSGQGITKFAPTPAAKVLKSYQVDGDFLRKAIGYGGVPQQAVDQIMGGIDQHPADGPLGGTVFDTVMGAFGVPAGTGAPLAGGDVVPPAGSGVGMEPGAIAPPEGGEAPVGSPVEIDPVASDISAGQPAVVGAPVEPVEPEAIPASGGEMANAPDASVTPEVDEGERSMSPEEQAAIRNGQTIGKCNVDTTPGDAAEGDEDAEPEQVDPRA